MCICTEKYEKWMLAHIKNSKKCVFLDVRCTRNVMKNKKFYFDKKTNLYKNDCGFIFSTYLFNSLYAVCT